MPGAADGGATPTQANAPKPGSSAAAALVFGLADQQADDQQPEPGNDANAPEPEPETLPKSEVKKIIAARDKAKAESRRVSTMLNAMAERLGIDPAELTVEEIDGAVQLKSSASLDKIVSTLRGKQSWQERETELRQQLARKNAQASAARDRWIQQQAATEPLKNELIKQGALPEALADVTQLLSTRVKAQLAVDEETGELKLSTTVLDDTGNPWMNAKGEPESIANLVATWLRDKPHYKAAKFRSGAGAGGRAPNVMGGLPAMEPGDRGNSAAAKIFGPGFVPDPQQQQRTAGGIFPASPRHKI